MSIEGREGGMVGHTHQSELSPYRCSGGRRRASAHTASSGGARLLRRPTQHKLHEGVRARRALIDRVARRLPRHLSEVQQPHHTRRIANLHLTQPNELHLPRGILEDGNLRRAAAAARCRQQVEHLISVDLKHGHSEGELPSSCIRCRQPAEEVRRDQAVDADPVGARRLAAAAHRVRLARAGWAVCEACRAPTCKDGRHQRARRRLVHVARVGGFVKEAVEAEDVVLEDALLVDALARLMQHTRARCAAACDHIELAGIALKRQQRTLAHSDAQPLRLRRRGWCARRDGRRRDAECVDHRLESARLVERRFEPSPLLLRSPAAPSLLARLLLEDNLGGRVRDGRA